VISLTTVMFLFGMSVPVGAVSISSPKPMSNITGTVQVLAVPDANEGKYAYAILLVNNQRLSMTNAQPLRFELDTTGLPNGAHLLQVELADMAGLLSTSKVVTVIVANPTLGGSVAIPTPPKPEPTVAKAEPPKATTPVVAKPPVVQPKPSAVTPQPIRGTELAVVLDGKPLDLSVRPIIDRGRALVMLRPLIDALGGTLSWDAEKKQAVAMVDKRQYAFTVGESVVQVDGQAMPIDRPVTLTAGRTVVPATIWRDLFGGALDYDSQYGSINLRMRLKELPAAVIASN